MPPLRVSERVNIPENEQRLLVSVRELKIASDGLLRAIPLGRLRINRWFNELVSKRAFYRFDDQPEHEITYAQLKGNQGLVRLYTGLGFIKADGTVLFPPEAKTDDYKFEWFSNDKRGFRPHPSLWSSSPTSLETVFRAGFETLELIAEASGLAIQKTGQTPLLPDPASGNKGAEM